MTDTPNPPTPEPIQPAPVTPTTPAEPAPDPADVEKNKIMGVLSYLGILVLIPILAAPQSKCARYHANQGFILLIAWVAGCIVIGCPLSLFQFFIHIRLLACCLDLVPLAFFVGFAVLAIMGIINAVNGQMKPLPLIGQFTILK